MDISDFDSANNLVSLFLTRADERGDAPFLWAKLGGQWRSLSWAEVARQVCQIAENLRGLGLVDGDRVVLLSENRPSPHAGQTDSWARGSESITRKWQLGQKRKAIAASLSMSI